MAGPFALFPPTTARPADLTAADVLRRAEERFQSLTSYECIVEAETRLGKKADAGVYRFWFKKPRRLRVRVLKGRHRGSEVAMDRSGAVRGHEGGLLKPIVMRLNATDNRLRNLRGVPLTELDWGSFYRKCRERAALPGSRLMLLPHAAGPYEVVVTYPQAGAAMREVYRIDPRQWTLTEGDVFENAVRVDHVLFRDVHLDVELEDEWFRL